MSTQWTLNDWARVVPLMLVSAAAGYYISRKLTSQDFYCVNKNIEKDKAKIVHTIDVEDIEPGKAKYYCRCWKSNDVPVVKSRFYANKETCIVRRCFSLGLTVAERNAIFDEKYFGARMHIDNRRVDFPKVFDSTGTYLEK